MTECPDHDFSPTITICVHIEHAIGTDALERAHVVLDDWLTPSLVCGWCELLISAAERSTEQPRIGFDHVLDSPLVGCCYSCVSEWFAATGQGDLSKAIAREREPHLR